MTTFDEGIDPAHPTIGAYPGAVVLGSRAIGEDIFSTESMILHRVLRRFPDAAVLRVFLSSVAGQFAYSYFERGMLVRAHAGGVDYGIVTEIGEPLAEERPHYEMSFLRNGGRFFRVEIDGQPTEFHSVAYGETLAFAVMARFLGCRLDQADSDIEPLAWPMESFEPVKRWWWPFG